MIDFQLIIQSLPSLLRASLVTLEIAAGALFMGLVGGTLLGILQTGPNRLVRTSVAFYTTLIRGTPMLIQIMFLYYVLSVHFNISAFAAALLAIGLNSSAYISQVIRSGILAVNRGQIEAAKTLGIGRYDLLRYIILPQAFRTILPALGNEAITLVKDSSLASLIGVVELYKQGQIIMSQTLDALSIYCILAIIYLIITSSISYLLHYFEKRLHRHVKNYPSF
ncbi:MAG: amino acid ABC transporter permease [Candidatus Babeliaceae bacterium]